MKETAVHELQVVLLYGHVPVLEYTLLLARTCTKTMKLIH